MTGGSVVNERIAQRRAAVIATRRRRRLRLLLTVAVVVALVVGALALERSSLVALASLEVRGVERLAEQEVLEAAGVELGTSVLRIRTGDVRDRVVALPLVAEATVERDGPLGLVVAVREVAPALTAVYADGTVLVDEAGLVLGPGTAPGTPSAVVPGQAPTAGERVADHPLLATVHAVLLDLPGPVAALVREASIDDAGEVRLELATGVAVRWGDDTRGAEKARSLGAVMEDLDGREVTAIDVRAPSAPTVVP